MRSRLYEACVAVDAMGSDKGYREVIAGVCSVLKEDRGRLKIILVGEEDSIKSELKRLGAFNDDRISVYHASQVIEMHEKPMQAMKSKKDASMFRALDLVKLGIAQAVLSCGNTGALMTAGTIKLRTMEGIERPALGVIIPAKNRNFILIDVGANPDPKPSNMFDNAILGVNYARIATGVRNPRVGLLSNGTEEGKGNVLTQNAHELLKNSNGVINYGGLIEGFQVFEGDCDVILCDGFTGNVLLKTLESILRMFTGIIKEEFTKTLMRKIAIGISARGAIRDLKKRMPIDKFSGSPLLGLNGLVVKGHGSSSAKQVAGALGITIQCLRRDLSRRISDDVKKTKESSKILQEANAILTE